MQHTLSFGPTTAPLRTKTGLTALLHLVHRGDLALQTVSIKYLEKGQTSMSADAIHQVVNKFLSKAPVEDFPDYVRVCGRSSRVVEITPSDFMDIESGISATKLKRLAGMDLRPMLHGIRVVQARRGDDRLFVKSSHDLKTWKA